MSYHFPSSSQPSTPGKTPNKSSGSLFVTSDHPSTTPAGPPRSLFSTTPAIPPPKNIFGSSQLAPTSAFSKQSTANGGRLGQRSGFKVSPKTAFGSGRTTKSSGLGREVKPSFLGAQRGQAVDSDDEEYEDTEGDDEDAEGESDELHDEEGDSEMDSEDAEGEEETEDEDAEGEDDEEFDEEDDMEADLPGTLPTGFNKPRKPDFMESAGPAFDWVGVAQEENVQPSPKGLKRSRDVGTTSLIQSIEADMPPAKRRESTLPRIAKDLAATQGTATLEDPDSLILGTEDAIKRFHDAMRAPRMGMHYEAGLKRAFTQVPEALIRLWSAQAKELEQNDGNLNTGIGPAEDSHPATKAGFVSSMLLLLHHQPSGRTQSLANGSNGQSLTGSAALLSLSDDSRLPYPRLFLNFLEEQHNTYGQGLNSVLGFRPNPTAHPNFWDALATATLRGRLSLVVEILQRADFTYAWTAKEEGQEHPGYQGPKLNLVNQVVGRLSEILLLAPGLRDGDWEVTNQDWSLFRRRAERALEELNDIAKRSKAAADGAVIEARNFGLQASSRRAHSFSNADATLPRSVHDFLKVIYNILLGHAPEILATAQDWLEATLALGVWWNGEDGSGVASGSLKASRRSATGRPIGHQRIVDTDPAAAYRRHLAIAVDVVTNGPEEDTLMVDINNAVEVALASVFEGNVEGVIALLQAWSLPITSAVLEIATWARWYESPSTDAPPEGFDDSDLMVLSFAKPDKGIVKDDVLLSYSDMLFEKAIVGSGPDPTEGWELAIDVSSRLDDELAASSRVDWILTKVPVNNSEKADKVIKTCLRYGLEAQVESVARRHADLLASTTHNYGSAIIFYARAHDAKKCKEVLDLLTSMCLIRSSAYPVFEQDKDEQGKQIDNSLPTLLSNPKLAIEKLKFLVDDQAAYILTNSLSGYATLRRFYDLRDEHVRPNSLGAKPSGLRPKARLRAAAKALLACIASAADSIRGGLFDKDADNVVEHDLLLALLAEAQELVASKETKLSMDQLMLLLRSIEDLQTVHTKIRLQCEDCFKTCLAAKYDSGSADKLDPRDMFKKTVSGLTDSSGFSLIGSEITSSSYAGNKGGSGGRKQEKDGVERAWDWRDYWSEDTVGDEVLEALRKGIAGEIASLWIADL